METTFDKDVDQLKRTKRNERWRDIMMGNRKPTSDQAAYLASYHFFGIFNKAIFTTLFIIAGCWWLLAS